MTTHITHFGHADKHERNPVILEKVLRGATLESVATEHGVTRVRVHQIVYKYSRIASRRVNTDDAKVYRGSLDVKRSVADRIMASLKLPNVLITAPPLPPTEPPAT